MSPDHSVSMDNISSPDIQPEAPATPQTRKVKRPWSVTLLVLGVLIITVINLARFILSLRYWDFLVSLPGPSPVYLAISGFAWAVAGGFLLWSLWKPVGWACRLMEAEALTYALYYWLDLLFIRDHPVNGAPLAIRAILPTHWQFSAGVTVVCLIYIVWTLGRSKVKVYFDQAMHEDKTKPPHDAQGG